MYGVVLLFVNIATAAAAAALVCLFVMFVVGIDFVHCCFGGLLVWLADPLGAAWHGGQ